MTADVEDEFTVAQATEPIDENGCLANARITCRHRDEIVEVDRAQVDLHRRVSQDDGVRGYRNDPLPGERRRQPCSDGRKHAAAGRASAGHRGSYRGHRPWSTRTAMDSEVVVLAEGDGEVTKVSATQITVRYDDGRVVDYHLTKYVRSNHTTCINQQPIVNAGQRVRYQ